MSARSVAIAAARRVVIKLGTRVLTDDGGALALGRLNEVVAVAAGLHGRQREVLLVTSGAVGLGREALGIPTPTELPLRQACAAVGQSRLMQLYSEACARHGVVCAQVLLAQADFADRNRYLNLRTTLETLLEHRALPIVNENDVVSTEELDLLSGKVFGDNDRLSALVASKLDADLLILLTDVTAIFDGDPRSRPGARRIARVGPDQAELGGVDAGGPAGPASRGGMRSKIDAATIAARAGCHAVVASGREPGTLVAVLGGEDVGTWFEPRPRGGMDARRRWIAFAATPRGALHLDAGAVEAVVHRGASLLARGVVTVDGAFAGGEVVELRGPDGAVLGRGMAWCDAATAREWMAGRAPDHARSHHALVHRDQLALIR